MLYFFLFSKTFCHCLFSPAAVFCDLSPHFRFCRCILSFTVVVVLLRCMICRCVLQFRATVQYGGYKYRIRIIRVFDAPRNVFRYHIKHQCMTAESSFVLSFVRFGESSSTKPKTNTFLAKMSISIGNNLKLSTSERPCRRKNRQKEMQKVLSTLESPERH